MKKRKTDYDAPDISVTQVEVESALCGSVKIANPNSDFGKIEDQLIDTEFGNGGWISTGENSNTGGQWKPVESTTD